jgi:hypothetical protein
MADQDELNRLRQQAIANARARQQQRAEATIVGASDINPSESVGPAAPSDLEERRRQAMERARAESESRRYAIDRRAAFEQAPEISMAGVQSILSPAGTPERGFMGPPESPSMMDIAAQEAKGAGLGVTGLVTYDPWEFGQILMKQDPNIGVVQSPEGEFFAVNRATDRVVSLNKKGLSPTDVMQALGAITPASRVARGTSLANRAAREMVFQSGVESGQTALGGEFNPEEIVLGVGTTAGTDLIPQGYRAARQMLSSDTPQEAGMKGVISEVGEAAIDQQPTRLRRAAETVRPEPTLVGAAQRLGVEESVPLSALSGNEQFRAVQAGLTARLGSDLADDQAQSILQLSENVARNLDEYGAAASRGAFDDVIRNRIQDDIAGLAEQSNYLYKALDKAVDRFGGRFQTVDTPILNSYTGQLNRAYKSLDQMPSGLRNILNQITDPDGISYEALDRLRRATGEQYAAALRGSNPYPDTDVRSLGQIYDVITRQQNQALEGIVGTRAPEIWGAAKGLVAQRKELEALSIQSLGRDLTNDLMPRLEQSLANIGRGNIQAFTSKINAVPEDLRPQAMVTALKGMMQKSARSADVDKDFAMSLSFYPNWWRQVKSDAKVFNLVTKYLEPEQVRFFDDVARLGGSLQRSIQKQPMNGRLVEFVESFNDSGGLISRILGVVGKDRGPVGMAARGGSAIFDSLVGATGRGDAIQQMSDLLRDNNFRRLVLRGAEGEPVDRVAENLIKSNAFKQWYNTASDSVRSGIQELGRRATQTIPNASAERILSAGIADYFTRSNVDEIEQYFTGEQ